MGSQELDTTERLSVQTHTHTHTYKIDNQWGFALWLRELKLGLCNDGEGWEHMYTCGWLMPIYGRGQHSIVKQVFFN